MVNNDSYSYVIEHDTGYAPNPFFGYMTLASCKPRLENSNGIRGWITPMKIEKENEVWIFVLGGSNLFLENVEYRKNKFMKIELPFIWGISLIIAASMIVWLWVNGTESILEGNGSM